MSEKITRVQRTAIELFDRNPIIISKSFTNTGVSPHTPSARWSYTVPKGRLFMLEAAQCSMVREVVPTTKGLAFAYITIDAVVLMRALLTKSGLVGDKADMILGHQFFLKEKSDVSGLTYDGNTGGSIDYTLTLKGTEFDDFPFDYDKFPEVWPPKADVQVPKKIKPWWEFW